MEMSDMNKALPVTADFNARDLNRHLAKVLEACDRLGVIRIKHRQGHMYELRRQAPPEPEKNEEISPWAKIAVRRKAMNMPKMTKAQSELLHKLIRGE